MAARTIGDRLALVFLGAVLAAGPTRAARGAILSASFDASVSSVDLTALGAADWAVFGRGRGADGPNSWQATDGKKGGEGILRKMTAAGLTRAFGGDGVEDTDFTQVAWSWDDGTQRTAVTHTTGSRSGTGMRVEIGPGGQVSFQFAAPGEGVKARACLLLRRDGVLQIVARHAGREQVIDTASANGLASVVYDGAEPLAILLRPPPAGGKAVARGFALTLGPVGRGGEPFRAPRARSPRDRLLARLGRAPEPDYLTLVRAYADCMIRQGRDRYGAVHSPLFASTLTRTRPPTLLPAPRFAPARGKVELPADLATWPGRPSPWVYQRFVNLPTLHALGSEDAHKETVVGEDPLEHLHAYRTLWKLSEVTGDARYGTEADRALVWWLTRTQSPKTGLYPWGEHLGWDFRADSPSYARPPYHTLYSRIFHEPRAVDFRDVLETLAALPAANGAKHTPLERFAIGLREWHVWDLERGHFTRHGDYFGNIKPSGHSEFPRIAGWFFDVWSKAYVVSKNAALRKRLAAYATTLLDALDRRVQQTGYFPFTARHETSNRTPEGYNPRQVLNAAAKIRLAGDRLQSAEPVLAAKLHRFADREFRYFAKRMEGAGPIDPYLGMTLKAACDTCPRADLLALFRRAADAALAADPSTTEKGRGPMPWARQIELLVAAHDRFGRPAYLRAARVTARAAAAMFLDEASPLPKVSADPLTLPDGTPFPAFYHAALGCDDLMYALACLAAATGR